MENGDFIVHLSHQGHVQLADLIISGTDPSGEVWYIGPTGRFRKSEPAAARANLLITETGERMVQLMRQPLPVSTAQGLQELNILLLNPGERESHSWTRAAQPLRLKLPE